MWQGSMGQTDVIDQDPPSCRSLGRLSIESDLVRSLVPRPRTVRGSFQASRNSLPIGLSLPVVSTDGRHGRVGFQRRGCCDGGVTSGAKSVKPGPITSEFLV